MSLGLALFVADGPRGLRKMALCGFAVGMMLLAGHLQLAAYGLMAFVCMLVVLVGLKARTKSAWLSGGLGLGALVLGAVMAAPQLMPVMAYSKLSHRQNVPTEEGYAAYVAAAIPPGEFVGRLVNPFSFGVPTVSASEQESITSYWPAISRARQGDNFAETASSVGPVVLGLLLLLGGVWVWKKSQPEVADDDARNTRDPIIAIGIVGLIAALLAVGTPLNKLLYYYAPGWSASGSPGRVVVLFVLVCCVVAGLGVTDLSRLPKKAMGWICFAAFLVMAGTVSIALSAAGQVPDGIPAETWASLTAKSASYNRILILGVPLIGLGALAVLSIKKETWVLAIALVSPVLLLGFGIVRSGDPSFLNATKSPNFEATRLRQQCLGSPECSEGVYASQHSIGHADSRCCGLRLIGQQASRRALEGTCRSGSCCPRQWQHYVSETYFRQSQACRKWGFDR